MKKFKIFFSWQSDLPSNKTKKIIEESIQIAKNMLSETIELVLDEATRERFGTPDIMQSIFDKIDECDLFIADVSIVGSYLPLKSVEDDEPKSKFFPNPNVLLELGYAASIKTWDRCICFANTDFGAINNLPFDLNHRRITPFSYSEKRRKAELSRIAGIIISTVQVYIDKPLPKKDFALHIIGCYDFSEKTIEQVIIPYNPVAFAIYNKQSKKILDEIKSIAEKVSAIHLPVRKNSQFDFDPDSEDMTLGEVMEDPKLSKQYTLSLKKLHDVKVDRSYIEEQIKRYFDFDLAEDFFDLGGLQEGSSILPYSSSTLEGTDQEKEKYSLLIDLEGKLADIGIRDMFLHTFDGIFIIPLAIKNISTKNDERITVDIKVIQGQPINPTRDLFNQEFTGLEACVYDKHLVKELLELPENGEITYDKSYSRETRESYILKNNMQIIDGFGYASEPEFNADDYERELQDYVQELSGATSNEYCFSIGALRPNETVWVDKVMLIQPIDGQIILEYSIKSNNSTGELCNKLYLKPEK